MYLHDWAGEDGFRSMVFDFEGCSYGASSECDAALRDEKYQGINVLLASYTYQDYSGSAFVLFERGGQLFEVHGSHCSCYGLEDQWTPEEVTLESLWHRLDKGELGKSYNGNEFVNELRDVLSQYESSCDIAKR